MTNIGEIKTYKELGLKSRYLRIWIECPVCHKQRWVKLVSTKEANYSGICSLCAVRKPDKWDVPLRENILNPKVGDISKLKSYRGVDIFALCIDCNKPRWMDYCDYIHHKNLRCINCARKLGNNRKPDIDKLPSKISNAIRANIRDSLHRKGLDKKERGWEKLVGYTIKDFMVHIEEQFQPGMTWDNYGKWHIDHIIPVIRFKFTSTDDIEFKKCWSLTNLQPLWAIDNLRKHTS